MSFQNINNFSTMHFYFFFFHSLIFPSLIVVIFTSTLNKKKIVKFDATISLRHYDNGSYTDVIVKKKNIKKLKSSPVLLSLP